MYSIVDLKHKIKAENFYKIIQNIERNNCAPLVSCQICNIQTMNAQQEFTDKGHYQ